MAKKRKPKRKYVRVVAVEGKWQVKFSHRYDGYSALDPVCLKVVAVAEAYKWARKFKPCTVFIYNKLGKRQVRFLVK